jgi:NADH dehydrogenase
MSFCSKADRAFSRICRPSLSEKAKWQLIHLGVNVKTDTQVKSIREGVVELANGKIINAGNIVWAAGVASTPLTKKLGCELDRGGRVKVIPI